MPAQPFLSLQDQNLGPDDVQRIIGKLADTTLQALKQANFSYNKISDKGAMSVANSLKALTALDLTANEIGAEGAAAIARLLETNTTLIGLDLSSNEIGDEGAKAIAKALATNRTLRRLRLTFNKIGDEGIKALLTTLENNEALIELGLKHNDVSSEGRANIEKINALIERNKKIHLCKTALSKMETSEFKESPGQVLAELKDALKAANEIITPTTQQKMNNAIELCEILYTLEKAGINRMRSYKEIILTLPEGITESDVISDDAKVVVQKVNAITNSGNGYLVVAREAFEKLSAIKAGDNRYSTAQQALWDLSADLLHIYKNETREEQLNRLQLCYEINASIDDQNERVVALSEAIIAAGIQRPEETGKKLCFLQPHGNTTAVEKTKDLNNNTNHTRLVNT